MSIRDMICEQIASIAQQQGKVLPALTDNLVLLESGLDSLCFAILVVRLDEKLGVDPFSQQDELIYPVTLADFVTLYEQSKR